MNILVASSNSTFYSELTKVLAEFEIERVTNGSDAQVELGKRNHQLLILDIEIQKHEFPYVIKFCKVNCPSINIVLYVESKDILKKMDIQEDELTNLGVMSVVYTSRKLERLKNMLSKEYSFENWKEIKVNNNSSSDQDVEDEVLNITDKHFTKLPLSSFFSGNAAIFDTFIKIGSSKYIKILKRGDFLDPSRLKKYSQEYSIKDLYFKTDDRKTYINFINTVYEKVKLLNKDDVVKVGAIVSGLTDQYLDEVHTKGLSKELFKEGQKLCESTNRILLNTQATKVLLEKIPEKARSHQFLTLIYSQAICINIDWAGSLTKENIGVASLFHDIGLVKFKWYLRNPKFKFGELSPTQVEEYQSHPELGYEMLSGNPHIKEAVRQMIVQHHENYIGTGFPNNLSYSKIYPLAQILSLADYFSHFILDHQITPLEALRRFIPDQKETEKFNPLYIKALIKGFIVD